MAINTKTYSQNNLTQQDDFRHSSVKIYNYKGDFEDITDNVVNINIFESIFNSTMTGTLTFGDVNSIVERLPVIGKEFLEFKIRTPVQYNGEYGGEINAVNHKFFVYKISVQEQVSARNQLVELSFCSVEMLKNSRVRVSKAYDGSYERAVQEIFKSKTILNSKKPLFLERTRLNQKVVVPNLRPFDAIKMFTRRSLSTISASASFLFYETTQGFHFRSLDSMFRDLKSGVGPATSMFTYMLETSNQPNPTTTTGDAYAALQRVYNHKFVNNMDTIEDSRSGMMSSKLITYNAYDKTFGTKEFNYSKDYFTLPHLEQDSESEFPPSYSIIPDTPADYTEEITNKQGLNNIYTDYTDGKTMFMSNTSKVHNTNLDSGYHAENTVQSRIHTLEILDKIKLNLTVPGNTHINAGQVVTVTVPSYALETYEKAQKQHNRFLTGRYLVTDLRHNIDFTNQKHRTVLTLSKETYGTPLVNSLEKPQIEYEDELVIVDIGEGKEYA